MTAADDTVIRPILGRLHCGHFGKDEKDQARAVIRPILGRLHCGVDLSYYLVGDRQVIRPILGRLHCGWDEGLTAKNFAGSSGRSSAGSIAA